MTETSITLTAEQLNSYFQDFYHKGAYYVFHELIQHYHSIMSDLNKIRKDNIELDENIRKLHDTLAYLETYIRSKELSIDYNIVLK